MTRDDTWFCFDDDTWCFFRWWHMFLFWWRHVVLFCRLWVQCAQTVRRQGARHVFRKQVQETQAPISAGENHPQTVVQQPRRKYVHAILHLLARHCLKLFYCREFYLEIFSTLGKKRACNCNLHNLFGVDWDLAEVWTGRLIRVLHVNFFVSILGTKGSLFHLHLDSHTNSGNSHSLSAKRSACCRYVRVHSHLRFITRDLLRQLFSSRNCKKWVRNPLLNFSVHLANSSRNSSLPINR